MNLYEAMFLLDPTFGATMENCESEIKRLLDRAEAEVVFTGKWDERRLAYRINGRKRGVYVLVYFKAAPDKIVGLQRDAQIAEEVLRLLVIRADEVTPEMMERHCELRGADRSSDEESSDGGRGGPPRAPNREPVATAAAAPTTTEVATPAESATVASSPEPSATGASEEAKAEGAE